MKTINISSRSAYPAGVLSNFTEREFVIDDVHCCSLEGFLQSLKFADESEAADTCTLIGAEAKKQGRKAPDWRETQTLWWLGQEIARDSEAYQTLLDRAYIAVARADKSFCDALLDSGDAVLIHTMGQDDPKMTVLTQSEFCDRLMKLRAHLQASSPLNELEKL